MTRNSSPMPAYMRIRQYVLSRITRGNVPGNKYNKLASVRELAAMHNVSLPTAMKAVKRLVADGVLISRQGVGTFFAAQPFDRRAAGCIGLIVSNGMQIHFDRGYLKIMAGIYDVLSNTRFMVQLINSGHRDKTLVKEVLLAHLDGMIWINPSRHVRSSLKTLEAAGVRVISIDMYRKGMAAGSISADLYEEGYRMAAFLLSHGHKRILRAGQDPQQYDGVVFNEEGFNAAFRERGLTPDKRLVLSRDAFATRLETLMDLDIPFTAMAIDSVLFQPALAVLRAKGRRVPQDVSIITEDDYSTMEMTSPVPTRVARPLRKLGEGAAHAMVEWIKGVRAAPFEIPLGWDVMDGETCAENKSSKRNNNYAP